MFKKLPVDPKIKGDAQKKTAHNSGWGSGPWEGYDMREFMDEMTANLKHEGRCQVPDIGSIGPDGKALEYLDVAKQLRDAGYGGITHTQKVIPSASRYHEFVRRITPLITEARQRVGDGALTKYLDRMGPMLADVHTIRLAEGAPHILIDFRKKFPGITQVETDHRSDPRLDLEPWEEINLDRTLSHRGNRKAIKAYGSDMIKAWLEHYGDNISYQTATGDDTEYTKKAASHFETRVALQGALDEIRRPVAGCS